MTDIIKKLDMIARNAESSPVFTDEDRWVRAEGIADTAYEAIEEIERLRDKVERLEGALADVLAYYSMPKEKE